MNGTLALFTIVAKRINMSELHIHFVKINSTDFAEAPCVFYGIISLEVMLSVAVILCHPIACIAIIRTKVMHRNFRVQVCLIITYFVIQVYCRFILLYYQLNDILPTKDDLLLFWVETTRDAILGYLCATPGSFAIERFVATRYWAWYEKERPSTLLILVTVEVVNIVPAFTNAWLCYTERINNTANFLTIGVFLIISVVLFLQTFLINLRLQKRIAQGAAINFYSVSRSFQVRENIEVLTYMSKLALPAATTSTLAFAGFGWKLYGPTEWLLSRNIAYAVFDLALALCGIIFLICAIIANVRFYNEFKKIYPISSIYRTISRKITSEKQYESRLPSEEASTYFSQLRSSWDLRMEGN